MQIRKQQVSRAISFRLKNFAEQLPIVSKIMLKSITYSFLFVVIMSLIHALPFPDDQLRRYRMKREVARESLKYEDTAMMQKQSNQFLIKGMKTYDKNGKSKTVFVTLKGSKVEIIKKPKHKFSSILAYWG